MTPSAFICHGAPDRVITASPAREFLEGFAQWLPPLRGIVVVSAHWQTDTLAITAPGQLDTIHDFAGFPRALYQQRYPAVQTDWITAQLETALDNAGLKPRMSQRGLDHGAWSVLLLAFPDAKLPIVALSLPHYSDLSGYVRLGQALGKLREQNILVLGSGSAVHNLALLSGGAVPLWAQEFKQWLHKAVQENDIDALCDLYRSAPHARMAHPTVEHYLPLLVAMGAARGEASQRVHNSDEYGSLNNSCWLFGEG